MKLNGLIVIMLLTSWSVFGQAQHDLLHEEQLSKMKTELSLTDDQLAELRRMNEIFQSNRAMLEADTVMSGEKLAKEKARILKERNTDLRRVLTEDQFSKLMKKMRGGDRGRTGGRGPSYEGLNDMASVLGLTDQQVESFKKINGQMSADLRKLRADTTIARGSKNTELKKIVDSRKAKIKKLLTDEQFVKFLEYEATATANRRRGPRAPGKK